MEYEDYIEFQKDCIKDVLDKIGISESDFLNDFIIAFEGFLRALSQEDPKILKGIGESLSNTETNVLNTVASMLKKMNEWENIKT